jgi:hypothetical protein
MFGTQDVTKKLNLYIKFYDMEIDNLTPDHLKLRIDPISLFVGGMRHIIGKLSMRATTFLWTSSQSEVCTWSYGPPKSRESQLW